MKIINSFVLLVMENMALMVKRDVKNVQFIVIVVFGNQKKMNLDVLIVIKIMNIVIKIIILKVKMINVLDAKILMK